MRVGWGIGKDAKKTNNVQSMIYEHILAICFSAGGVRVCNRIIVVPFADIYGGLEMSHTDHLPLLFLRYFFRTISDFYFVFCPHFLKIGKRKICICIKKFLFFSISLHFIHLERKKCKNCFTNNRVFLYNFL